MFWKREIPVPFDQHPDKSLVLGKEYFSEFDPEEAGEQKWGIYKTSLARTVDIPSSAAFWVTNRQHAVILVAYFDNYKSNDTSGAADQEQG